jgi:hypothetical protein
MAAYQPIQAQSEYDRVEKVKLAGQKKPPSINEPVES